MKSTVHLPGGDVREFNGCGYKVDDLGALHVFQRVGEGRSLMVAAFAPGAWAFVLGAEPAR